MTPSKLAQVKPQGARFPRRLAGPDGRGCGAAARAPAGRTAQDAQAQARRARILRRPGRHSSALGERLPRLDFGLLQPRGLVARATGKGRSGGAEFAGAIRADRQAPARTWRRRPRRCAKKQQGKPAATDRTLLEFEVEFRAIDKIMDQGARWLQDMRNQLKVREAARHRRRRPAADQGRRRALRDPGGAAQGAAGGEHGGAACAPAGARPRRPARGAAAKSLQQALAADVKAWRDTARPRWPRRPASGSGHALSLDEPDGSHRDLQLCVKQAVSGLQRSCRRRKRRWRRNSPRCGAACRRRLSSHRAERPWRSSPSTSATRA